MMMRRMLARAFALMSAVGVGTLMIFGPSSASIQEATATEAKLPSAGMAAAAPEQVVAAEEALARADPRDVARAQAKASYTMYLMSGALASRGVDSDKADPEALRKLMDEIAPWAEEQADTWARSLDTDALPLTGVEPKFECKEKFDCDYHADCDFAKNCVVTDCDDGRCRGCPSIWGLDKLVFDKWCTYTCVKVKDVVGSAVRVHTRPFNVWKQFCLAK
jgi:hypothetical protein